MAMWRAWSRAATDGELGAIARELASAWDDSHPKWCFVEGPTCAAFVELEPALAQVEESWLLRLFDGHSELCARRRGFDRERPWLVRVIATQAPAGGSWGSTPTDLGDGEERVLLLYGKADGEGRFVHGTQFRHPFEYPGVAAPPGGGATLVVEAHSTDGGDPVVRWVRLRAAEGG